MSQAFKQLRGTGVALVTPFTKTGDIDFPALKKIINHIISGKCEYIVVLGTTAESATLTGEEKAAVIDFVRKTVKGKIPLVLGLGGNNTMELVHELKTGDLRGFDAILSVSPYYNRPSQEGIYQHYKKLAGVSPLPIILYNVPSRTGSNITAETTLRLANDFSNIIGIKEASGNIEQCMFIIKDKPKNFLVISGDDAITLPLIGAGADGVISVVANAYPKKFSAMVRNALNNDFPKAQKLHYELLPFIPLLFAEGNPAGVKSALQTMGLSTDNVRLPLVPASTQLTGWIANFVKKYK